MQIVSLTSLPIAPLNEAEVWEWGALADIGVTGTVSAVNELGWAAGEETDAGRNDVAAFLWADGTVTVLPQLVTAAALNDSGAVAGTIAHGGALPEAAVYQDGQVTLLGFLDSMQAGAYSKATAINNKGEVVGDSLAANGVGHAFLWKNGAMADLGVITAGDAGSAAALNDSGQVVGAETSAGGAHSIAVLWQDGQAIALAQPAGDAYSYASGINNAGLIVGADSTEAILWDQGQAITLDSLLPANSGWILATADHIDNQNRIFGRGSFDGQAVSYELSLGDGGTAQIGVSAEMAASIGAAADTPLTVMDGAEDVEASLDALRPLAAAGKLADVGFICLTFPTLTATTAQMSADAGVLAKFSGDFLVTSPGGSLAGFAGTADQYSVTPGSIAQGGVEVSGNGVDIEVSGPAVLRFSDQTELVAAAPGSWGTVTSGNIAELYGAVFGREPDIGGLTFYQDYLQNHPSTPLLQFADWFLGSAEYRSAHAYAPGAAGDTRFIEDSYQNLLHRTPSQGEIDFYLTTLMSRPDAHALMLVCFSASAEFLSDVQLSAGGSGGGQHWLILA